jgi:ATP-dependent RNA helicase DeaD
LSDQLTESTDVTEVVSPSPFAALGLDPKIVEALTAAGYADPTPIQREAIPHLLAGRDLIGLAATGTGKTAAFALPLVHRLGLAAERKHPAALVLVPTRELAIQVAKAISTYGKPMKIKVVPIYGGTGYAEQVRGLRQKPDVVVATPGRALDHLRNGVLDLTNVSAVILDEADEMLDMGFADDLDALLTATPKTRQTMLFSATMPPRIAAIAAKHLTDPQRVEIARAKPAAGEAPKVRELVYVVRHDQKALALARLLDFEGATSAIVFCRTRNDADGVADTLVSRGFRPESIHGGLTQEQRDRVMQKFRSGAVPVLVATDVAARGLDIGHLSHVVNFNVPESADTYVHRVGRVGRAGREGTAITLADPRERHLLQQVERTTGRRFTGSTMPTKADIRAKRLERTQGAILDTLAAGGQAEFRKTIDELATKLDPKDIAAAVLAMLTKATQTADDEPDIQPAQPQRDNFQQRRTSGPRYQQDRPARPKGGMTRVWIGAGRQAGVGRRELMEVFENEVGLTARDIGTIDVLDRFCVVDVPGEVSEFVVGTLNGMRFNGRPVPVRLDRTGMPA